MTNNRQTTRNTHLPIIISEIDHGLLFCFLSLLVIGAVMVASASLSIAEQRYDQPFYFLGRHLFSIVVGLVAAYGVLQVPVKFWSKNSYLLLILSIVLLITVFIPGLGIKVNGSTRWVDLGLRLQASEPTKLFVIIYLASYLVRHADAVRNSVTGLVRPLLVLAVIAILLLLEPDFGVTVVLLATALGMLFMGGVSLFRFGSCGAIALVILGGIAMLEPYRVKRLLTFIDPWEHSLEAGYQLTQALIAFGRGEWLGVGLGGSIQKLEYLPEAHTDFIFAVLAEEFGLIGTVSMIVLFLVVVIRAFRIGYLAELHDNLFSAYLSYGLGLLIGFQAFINIGVNMGALPTKGLTLPLISYGNNSMIVMCIAFSLLARVSYEVQIDNSKAIFRT